MKPAGIAFACAACTLAGAILSGPVALVLVETIRPQPAWIDATTFAANFHWIQSAPYFAGLLLVGGFVSLIAALHRLSADVHRARTGIAVAFAAAFGAMVFVNYAIQTTFVPALLSTGRAESIELAGSLSMVNPKSLGWALEMWGYGVLGVATWLVAPVLRALPRGRTAAALFIANGPASVCAAFATAVQPGWLLTPAGLLLFALWNLLVLLMVSLTMLGLRGGRSTVCSTASTPTVPVRRA